MISELLSSIILATNISSCVVPAATYAQGSSIVYTPKISESRINQNADDTEYDAVRLSPDNFYELDSYQFSISSELYGRLGNTDYDYYYISVLSKSVFTFSVTNESILPYSFSIYTYVNSHQDDEYVYSSSSVILSVDVEEEYQNSIVLNPGTYYVLFDGLGTDLGGELIANYVFSGTVRKNCSQYSIDVNEARFGKGLKGLLWENNCLPINFEEESVNQSITYYQWNKNNCNSPKYNLDDLRTISNGNKIRYKTYYIFDIVLIKDIKDYFSKLKAELTKIVGNQSNQLNDLEVAYSITGDALSITTRIIDCLNNPIASFVFNTSSKLIDFGFQSIISSLKKNILTNALTISTLSNIVESLFQTLLNIYEYKVEGSSPNHYAQWKGLELSLFYSIEKENVDIGYPKHYLYFPYEYLEINTFSAYYNSMISNSLPDTYGTNGEIYAITDDGINFYEETPQTNLIDDKLSDSDDGLNLENVVCGQVFLYKFLSPKSATFYFHSYSTMVMEDPRVDIFFVKPQGYDNANRIGSYKGKFVDPKNGNSHGTYFSIYLNEGETLYIRLIIQEIYNSNGKSTIGLKINDKKPDNAYHEHNYSSYSYINGSQHRVSCSCGDSYLEYHAVRSNSRICMYCRGIVDKGIIDIPFSLLDRSIEGYYVHERGVKIYE